MDEMKVRVSKAPPWGGGVELWIRQGRSYCVSLVMQEAEVGKLAPIDPTLRVSDEQAQVLMDDLWNCGFRPTEGSGSAGAMRAVENHVSDLRKIAFKALDIPDR